MTWLLGMAVAFAYLLGAVVAAVILAAIGTANPRTRGDSWTGDDQLDLISVALWPATFFIIGAMRVGEVLAAVLVRQRP